MKKRLISWLLILALCVSILPAAALAAGPETVTEPTEAEQAIAPAEPLRAVGANSTEHTHFLCGEKDTCNKEGHDDEGENKVTFEAWPTTWPDGKITSGKYYLTGNLNYFTVPEGVDLTICLNGHDISSGSEGPTIEVKPGATLTLCDCKGSSTYGGYITHARNVHGAGVFVGQKDDTVESNGQNSAVFNMYGGTISGNSDTESGYNYTFGSGVVVMGGTFHMYGGKIANNRVDASSYNGSYGGGVSVYNNGIFTMSGGEIRENTAKYGGGVSVGRGSGTDHSKNKTGGTFTMSGGKITLNTGTYNAGGVCVGGGSDTHFTISGSAQITDNYQGASYPNGTVNNVYLLEGNTEFEVEDAIINVGALAADAEIGVTTEKGVQVVATGVSQAAKGRFTSDNKQYYLKYSNVDKTLTMVKATTTHTAHPVCGDADCKEHENLASWTGISTLTNNMAAGNYYLTADVELSSKWTCSANVNLCLNGHSITRNGTEAAITLSTLNGLTLNLCDCAGSGEITHGTNPDDGKTFTGAGVEVPGTQTFNMYGGIITGNTTTTGGGVLLGPGSTFNMYGGSITGNKAKMETGGSTSNGHGGGVYVNGISGSYAYFNMYGGTIEDNTATNSGGGVYVDYGTFKMSGGSITGNTAKTAGGVYYSAPNGLFVSGKAKITDNKDTSGAKSNVYVPSSGGDPKTVPFYIGEDGLDTAAEIGVRVNDGVIATGEHSMVAQLAPYASKTDAYHDGNFISDNDGDYGFKLEAAESKYTTANGYVVNLYNGLPHVHYLCNGKDENGENKCTGVGGHSESEAVTFQPWTDATRLPETAGNYYLTTDVELSGSWRLEGIEVNLCLNGHSITRSSDYAVITVTYKSQGNLHGKLAVCDCNGSKQNNGVITHGENVGGVGVELQYASTFDMYGGSITGNSGYGVNVGGSATFHMYGGSITGNSYGVDVDGTMTVSGDVKITDNTSGNVDLLSGRTITVSGALSDTAKIGVTTEIPDGSYVTVARGTDTSLLTESDLGRFESDNTSYGKKFVDGSVIIYNGTLHEHAACGTKGCTEHSGLNDEVWLPLTYSTSQYDSSPHLIYGGTGAGKTYNNTPNYYVLPAGNYYLYENITTDLPIMINGNVNLCLNGHTITTTADLSGSGKALIKSEGHALTICDCSTSGNGKINVPSSTNGIFTTGALTMYGGTISGGVMGVYVYTLNSSSSVGTFQMYGGTIAGNGTGVSRNDTTNTLTFGGDAKVKDNTTINVSLLNTGTITIDASLTAEARIGVYFTQVPADTERKQFATGATGELDYAAIFSCDNGSDYVLTKDDSGNLYFGKHQHSWKYELESGKTDTITATCTAGGCNLTDKSGGSVTIAAPAEDTLTYDGNGKPATVTASTDWQGPAKNTIKVSYTYGGGSTPTMLEGDAEPTRANTYTASITMGEGENSATASVTYEIKKATPQASDFTFTAPGNLTYDGNAKTATVTSNEISSDYITVKYYQGETEVSNPTNAGAYTVKIDVAESGNYNPASALTANTWTFEIAKDTTTPVVTLSGEMTYTSNQITPAVTVTVGGKTLTENTDYTVTYGTNIAAGEQAGSVIIQAKGNYGFTQITRNFDIGKRYIAVKAENKSSRVGQNLVPLTYTCTTAGLPYEGDTFSGALATDANKDKAGTYDIEQGTLSLGDNYNIDFTKGTYTVNAKNAQTNFKFADNTTTVTKTYGTDTEFTITAIDAENGSNVSYSCDPKYAAVAEVDSKTGEVTIKGAGTAVIKATASATDDYSEATAEYTLTVSPKTLTAADLEFTSNSTFTKVYDGNTTCTTATVRVKDRAVVNTGDVMPALTGTFAYNSENVKDANTITFTSTASSNTNYTLPAGLTVQHEANITRAELEASGTAAASATYGTQVKAITISGLTVKMKNTDTTVDGTWGWATSAAVDDVPVVGTQTAYAAVFSPASNADNYQLLTANIRPTITPAAGGSKGSKELQQRFTNTAEQTVQISWNLPAGQTWNYNSSYSTSTGTPARVDHRVDSATGTLYYTITGGSAGEQITFTVTAKCNNYNDFTYTVTVRLMARDPQTLEFKGVTDGKVTKTYGDQPFTQTVTGAQTTVTYASSNTSVATVDATTGEVTIVGAGTAIIKAKASETADFEEKEISYTLTVNKLRIAVPTAGTNKLEYNGKEQTYTPDGLNTEYCTIINNKATDVLANNANYTATVSLKDTANTEWNEGVDNVEPREYKFQITPAPATVTALDKKITAGQPAPQLTAADYTVTGLFGEDKLSSVSLHYADPSALGTTVTPDTSKAGTYAIVAGFSATRSTNYDVTFVNGTLTIEAAQTSQKLGISAPERTPGGSYELTPKNAQPGDTVTITVSPDKGYELGDLTVRDVDGNELDLKRERNGDYTFTMPKSSVSVSISFVREDDALFDDVFASDYYYNAVQWAAEQGITGGVSKNLFAPGAACTRAQIVTFLWRAAGSPEPEALSAFKDVPASAYYAKAVAWAVENGITNGLSADAFGPDAPCTRAQAVTFLARALDESAEGTADFADVPADAYYARPVAWAVEASVTNGVSKTRFAPNDPCTRAQIVTFLYRAYKRVR